MVYIIQINIGFVTAKGGNNIHFHALYCLHNMTGVAYIPFKYFTLSWF